VQDYTTDFSLSVHSFLIFFDILKAVTAVTIPHQSLQFYFSSCFLSASNVKYDMFPHLQVQRVYTAPRHPVNWLRPAM